MALDPKTPGVYVEEVSIFPPSITSVATAIPAFIGYTATGGGTVARISSMNDYVAKFGGAAKYIKLTLAGTSVANTTVTAATDGLNFSMYYALQMYFANGGGPCYVASAGNHPSSASLGNFQVALALLELEDEPTLIVTPDIRLLTTNAYSFQNEVLAQCATLQDRFGILDVNAPGTSASAAATDFRSGIGTQNLKYGAVYTPDLVTTLGYANEAIFFADTTTGPLYGSLNTKTLATVLAESLTPSGATTAGQFLQVEKRVRDVIATLSITLAPSSAIAGVYAAVDRSRGVWKAPANISLNAVTKPSFVVTHDDQQDLNVPTDGKAVNAIRAFTGKGVLVWGARTLAGNDNEWRYVSVRRFFIMAEESIRKATEWVVFEPNDANLWLKVKTMIENYLLNLWKDGALAGAVPKDAFFVKVGLNQTMTAQDILEGKLIIEVGMAAVRPAEFVILKFAHKMQES